MKEVFNRLLIKLTGFKALFTIAVLMLLTLHDFTPENADVLVKLVYSVLGIKGVQYMAEAVGKIRGEK